MSNRRKIRIVISSTQKAMRVPRKRIVELIGFIARREKTKLADIDIAVVSGRQIAAMNRKYLRHAGRTDVLSFDLTGEGEESISAQIIVCGDVAVAEAAKRGGGPQAELLLYVTHGLLHVLGYDDTTARTATRMYARQEKLLEAFLAASKR